jgi:hypothetical protein
MVVEAAMAEKWPSGRMAQWYCARWRRLGGLKTSAGLKKHVSKRVVKTSFFE